MTAFGIHSVSSLHFAPFYLILYGVTVQGVGGMQAATRSGSTRSNSLQRKSREASVSRSCCFFLLLLFLNKMAVIPSRIESSGEGSFTLTNSCDCLDWSIITWFFTGLVGGRQGGDIRLPAPDVHTALGACLTPFFQNWYHSPGEGILETGGNFKSVSTKVMSQK